jgi:hypothetical protein
MDSDLSPVTEVNRDAEFCESRNANTLVVAVGAGHSGIGSQERVCEDRDESY